MDENPYDILGVPRTATMDEVKKAYRKKARENHPDLNPDDPAAEERMNKVNEAYDRITNPEKYAASDARRRGYGAPYSPGYNGYSNPNAGGSAGAGQAGRPGAGGYAQGNPYSGYGEGQNPYQWTTVNFEDFFTGWGQAQGPIHPEANAADSAEVRQAIFCINSSKWADAIGILQNIPSTGRNARWHYLFALANNGAGNAVAANDNIRKARELDPNNPDYLRAQTQFAHAARSYDQQAQGRGFSTIGIDPMTLCCACMCCGPAMANMTRWCVYGM